MKLSFTLFFTVMLLSLWDPSRIYAQCFSCNNIIPVQGASNAGNVSTGCVPSPAGANFGCQGYRIDGLSTPALIPGGTIYYRTGNGGSCSTGGMTSVYVELDGDCTPPPPGLGEVSSSGVYNGILSVPLTATKVIIYVCRDNGGGNPNLCILSILGFPSASVTSTPQTCVGINDGTITAKATISGASLVGVLTYSINGVGGSTANTTGIFTGLAPGTYTVTAYDSGNPSFFTTTTVVVAAATNVFSASCPASTNLGIFTCNTVGSILSMPATINALRLAPYNMSIGSMPCGTLRFTATDNAVINTCASTTQTITRTITVWDDRGSPANGVRDASEPFTTCNFTFTINPDLASPTIGGCPANLVLECDGSYATDINTWLSDAATAIKAGSTDGCDNNLVVTNNYVMGTVPALSCDQSTSLSVVFTVTDDCGNNSQCTRTIVIDDSTAPTIGGCPANLVLECDGSYATDINTWLSDAATAIKAGSTDGCDNNLVVTNNYVMGTVPALSCDQSTSLSVVFTVTDDCGNNSQCTRTIVIDDSTAPTIGGCPANLVLECDGSYATDINTWLSDAATAIKAGSTDGCDNNLVVTNNYVMGTVPALSCDQSTSLSVVFTVTDDCGNNSQCTRTIVIDDSTAPTIGGCPANLVLECDGSYATDINTWLSDAATAIKAGSTDGCDNNLVVTNNYVMGTLPPLSCDQSAGLSVVFTVTDDCGNNSQCTRTIVIDDNTVPTIGGCPANLVLECDGSYATDINTWLSDAATAIKAGSTDGCDNNLVVTNNYVMGTVPALSCDQSTSLSVVFTVTDDCGNNSQCTRTIIIDDNTVPTIGGCPSNLVLECDQDYTTDINTWLSDAATAIKAGSTDGCDNNLVVTNNYVMGTVPALSCDQSTSLSVVFTVTDDCGNNSQCTRTIVIDDSTAPTIGGCPANLVLECDGSYATDINTWLSDAATAIKAGSTDGCDNNLVVTNNYVMGTVPALSCDQSTSLSVVFTVTDDCGNNSQCTRTIVIDDSTAPTIGGCPANLVLECDGSYATDINTWLSDAATAIKAGSTDGCDNNLVVTNNYVMGTVPALSCDQSTSLSVVFTVTDDCGNNSQCTRTIIIDDNTVPTIGGCPSNLVLECDQDYTTDINTWLSDAATAIKAGSTDGCDNNLVVTNNYVMGTVPALSCDQSAGLSVVFTVTDDCGNNSQCTRTIIIDDNTVPTIGGCPSNLVLECDQDYTTDINTWLSDAATAIKAGSTDGCDNNLVVTNNYVMGTVPALSCDQSTGLSVVFTVTDDCGNNSQCTRTIVIDDSTAPTIGGCPANLVLECDGSYATDINTWLSDAATTIMAGSTDACDNTLMVSNDYGIGVPLAGSCNQSTGLSVVFTVTDDCGNNSQCTRTIIIDDNTVPTIGGCPSNLVLECDQDYTTDINTWLSDAATAIKAGSTDGCDNNLVVTNNYVMGTVPALSCDQSAGLSVVFTVTDDCGNNSQCTRTIVIDDNTAPTIGGCPANLVLECDGSYATDINTWLSDAATAIKAGSTDGCDNNLVVTNNYVMGTLPALSCDQSTGLSVVFTVTDDCGNNSQCTRTIIIDDNTVPTIGGCPANLVLECDGSYATDINTWLSDAATAIKAGSTDGCDNNLVVTNNYVMGTVPALSCDQSTSLSVVFTVTDDCGNNSQCTRTIIIDDNTVPTIGGCPSNLVLECDQDYTTDINTWLSDAATAIKAGSTDGCDNNLVVTNNYVMGTVPALSCDQSTSLSVVFTVTDDCGNNSQCTRTIVIDDSTAPTIGGCPANLVLECDGSYATDINTWLSDAATTIMAGSTDACDNTLMVSNDYGIGVPLAGSCNQSTGLSVVFTVTDDCGNNSQCTRTIIIDDNTVPTIGGCPSNLVLECDQDYTTDINTWLSDAATAIKAGSTDGCDNNLVVTNNYVMGTVPALSCDQSTSLSVVFTVTDDCGNNSQCTRTIVIDDSTAPTIGGCPANLVLECDGSYATDINTWLSDAATAIKAGSTDGCDNNLVVTNNYVMGTVPALSCDQSTSLSVVFTVTDDCGNNSQCTRTIIIDDSTAPTIGGCPANLVLECDGSYATDINTWLSDAATAIKAGSTDGCDNNLVVTNNYVMGTVPALSCDQSAGLSVVFTVTDDCGNNSQCTRTIVIDDSTAPTIGGCPANLVLECDGSYATDINTWLSDAATAIKAGSTDGCDNNLVVTNNYVMGTVPALSCDQSAGLSVVFTVTDDCGNNSQCTRTIIIDDNTVPTIGGCPSNLVLECDQDYTTDINTWLSDAATAIKAGSTDGCDNNLVVTNNYVMGTVPALSCDQSAGLSVVFTVTDDCGNNSQCTRTIVIDDNTAPTIGGCPANLVLECDGSYATDINTWLSDAATAIKAGSTDGCDNNLVVTNNYVMGTLPALSCDQSTGLSVVFTVTDDCGNNSQCTRTIIIDDNTVPTIGGCPANLVLECDGSYATDINTWLSDAATAIKAGSTDGCDNNLVVTNNYVMGTVPALSCDQSTSLSVVFTVTDDCGNNSQCTRTIIIDDNTVPTIGGCPSNLVLECDQDYTTDINTWLSDAATAIKAGSTDGCDNNLVVTNNYVMGTVPALSCDQSTSLSVVFTVTDDCGNNSQCTRTIVIDDSTAPTIGGCPANLVLECDGSYATDINTWLSDAATTIMAGSTDACDNTLMVSNDYGIGVPLAGSCNQSTGLSVVFTVTDDCGNNSQCTRTIIIDDNTVPTIGGCPSNLVLECDQDYTTDINTWLSDAATAIKAGSTDGCDNNLVVTNNYVMGTVPALSCDQSTSLSVVFTVTDDCGNNSQCTRTIVIDDSTAPTIGGCPANLVLECDGSYATDINTWLSDAATAIKAGSTDGCDNNLVVTNNYVMGTVPALSCDQSTSLSVVFTVTDDCGNNSQCTRTIIIDDSTAPTIGGCPANLVLECDGSYATDINTWLSDAATAIKAGSTDGCDNNLVVTNNYVMGTVPALSCDQSAGLSVVFTVTDDCGNNSQCTRTIVIDDSTAPTIGGCPANLVLECDGSYATDINTWLSDAATAIKAGSTDGCDNNLVVTNNYVMGTVPALSCDQSAGLSVVFTVTDDCGNNSQCTRTIIIDDNTVPTIGGCPSNLVLECDQDYTTDINTWLSDAATAIKAGSTDGCDNNLVVTNNYVMGTVPALSCDQSAGLSVVFTVTDDCGNNSQCTRTIVIDDSTAPTLAGCPNNQTVILNAACQANMPDFTTGVTASDACIATANIRIMQMPAPGTTINGTAPVTVTVVAKDDCDNVSLPCVFTITGLTPEINIQGTGGLTVLNGDNTPAAADGTYMGETLPNVPVSRTFTIQNLGSNVLAISSITSSNTAFTVGGFSTPLPAFIPPSGIVTFAVTFNSAIVGVSDAAIHILSSDCDESAYEFNVRATINCSTPSFVTCPGNQTIAVAAGQCSNAAVYSVEVSGIPAPELSYTFSGATNSTGTGTGSGSTFNKGVTLVTLTASNACGSAVCSFYITVEDLQLPAITCPANIAVGNTPGLCGASVTYVPQVSDNCPGVTVSVISGPSSGSLFPIGSTTVVLKATDAAGLTATCQFLVQVTDTEPISIICPASVTVNATSGTCDRQLSFPDVVASDNCGPVTITQTGGLPNGSTFPVGTTVMRYRAVNNSIPPQVAECTFTVQVYDIQTPVITCPGNQTVVTSPNTCSANVTYPKPTVSDNCLLPAGQPVWVSGGTGTTVGATTATATFGPTINTVIWKVTDASGNTQTCTFRVTVTDNQAPTINCPSTPVVVNTSPGVCTAAATYTVPTATDNCTAAPVVTRISGPAPGTLLASGTHTVVFRAMDAAGRSSTCQLKLQVLDNHRPSITCPANVTSSAALNLCCVAVNYAMPSAMDNCSGATVMVESGLVSGSTFYTGVNTVVLRATDASGNTSTCSFTVTILDTQSPVISCPPNVTVAGSGSPCGFASNLLLNPTVQENCVLQSLTTDAPVRLPGGAITAISWTATDEANLVSTCQYKVTVLSCNGSRSGDIQERGNVLEITEADLNIAPNPAIGEVQLIWHGVSETGGYVVIYDQMGREVWRSVVSAGSGSYLVDTRHSGLLAGLYRVCLYTERYVLTRNLVIIE